MRLKGDDLVEAGVTLDVFTRSYTRLRELSSSAAYVLSQNLISDRSRATDMSPAEQKFLSAYLELIESKKPAPRE